MDLIDGIPTGSVRISFGYMSTFSDAQRFLKFIRDCFVEKEAGISSSCATSLEKNNSSLGGRGDIIENGFEIFNDKQDSQAIIDGCYKSLTLLKICIFPIKSCGAFEVNISGHNLLN